MNKDRVVKDYTIEIKGRAMDKLTGENPVDAALNTVEIMRQIVLADDSLNNSLKAQYEILYSQYKFYHTFLESV